MERRYIYKLRLHNGGYIESEGTGWEDAARNAEIDPRLVKRHLPVAVVKTPEELARQAERLAKLREKKRLEQESEESE